MGEKMSKSIKNISLELFRRRYCRTNRKGKTKLLDELCDLYGYNRKYLLQVFNGLTRKQYLRRGPKKKYSEKDLKEPLIKVWLGTDQMGSKKLKAAMPLWLPHYEQEFGFLSKEVKSQLLKMSASTIDRLLKPLRLKYKRRGLTGTKPGYLLKNQIPIKTDHWDVTKPGFMEADTVAHCGNSMAGDFIWSITLTDIFSGWTEARASWNKGAEGIVNQIKKVEASLPFTILGFDCDNGSEFLNWHLIRYFVENRRNQVQFTRSRPYKKNDNAHVEQKNWSFVRHLLGYDRLDDARIVQLLNDLYANEWSLYQNYFCPTMKLLQKEKINAKYRKKYDKPKTAYQRLMESEYVEKKVKTKLLRQYQKLNPFTLKKMIEKKLREIFKYVTVSSKVRKRI
jgi:hypothetical protein